MARLQRTGRSRQSSCQVVNYFRCPYGEERKQLLEDGCAAYKLWEDIEWYDRHWHRSHISQPTPSESKWYHYDEPDIIHVANFEDIVKAIDDGRLATIMRERERYVRETGNRKWAF